MGQIVELAVVVLGFVTFIYAVTREDYEECDETGCDLCPFPRCEDAPKDLSKAQMRKCVKWKVKSLPLFSKIL